MTSKQELPIIVMSPSVNEAMSTLREFLFERVYNPSLVKEEAKRARKVVRLLYEYFMEHKEKLPGEYALHNEPLAQRVVDYIAGMTDQYALRVGNELGLFGHYRGELERQSAM